TAFESRSLFRLSATTSEGLAALMSAIVAFIGDTPAELLPDSIVTSSRQNDALLKALTSLRKSCEAARLSTPHEMILLDLYEALAALNELTGEVVTDDILGHIFSRFCVGK